MARNNRAMGNAYSSDMGIVSKDAQALEVGLNLHYARR